jgi:hypothetical protein
METPQDIRVVSSREARIVGALYFAWLPMGCVRSVYIEFTIIGGNAATRAARIVDNAMTRGFGCWPTRVLMAFTVLAMYRLVSAFSSRAYLILGGLLVALLFLVNALNDFAMLLFAQAESALSALSEAERHGFLWFFLRMHILTKETGRLLWGLLWLIPLGALIYRTRILPRVLGILLVVCGLSCIACAAWFVLPAADANRLVLSIWPLFLVEDVVALWLLIRGLPPGLRREAA